MCVDQVNLLLIINLDRKSTEKESELKSISFPGFNRCFHSTAWISIFIQTKPSLSLLFVIIILKKDCYFQGSHQWNVRQICKDIDPTLSFMVSCDSKTPFLILFPPPTVVFLFLGKITMKELFSWHVLFFF